MHQSIKPGGSSIMSTLSGLEFEEAPDTAMIHPEFSLTVACEVLHAKLALEFWKKSSSDV